MKRRSAAGLVAVLLSVCCALPVQGRSPLAGAVLAAGGGPGAFKSTTLLGFLAGGDPGILLGQLTQADGAAAVKRSIEVLDFCVRDATRLEVIRAPDQVMLRGDKGDGERLTRALYAAGVRHSGASFTTQVLLHRLLPQRERRTIVSDAFARFGEPAVATFEREVARVLGTLYAGRGR